MKNTPYIACEWEIIFMNINNMNFKDLHVSVDDEDTFEITIRLSKLTDS